MDGDEARLIKEVRREGDAIVVVVEGEVTLDASPKFHKELDDLCTSEPARLIINLAGVNHIDSAGVGTLVAIYRRLRQYRLLPWFYTVAGRP